MKVKTFRIKTNDDLKLLLDFINMQSQEVEVLIREYQEDRTVAQNIHYWKVITKLAKEMGLSKNDAHELYKRRCLVKIFERDDPGYAYTVNKIRKLYTKGFKQEAEEIFNQIVKLTSTTSATVKQMREYIKDVKQDALDNGLQSHLELDKE